MLRLPERAAVPRSGVVALAGLLLVGVLFSGDSFWVAAGAVALAGTLLALALLGLLPLPRGGVFLLGSLLAVAAWSGLSVAWSIAPDRSWDELNRTLVYAGFALLGLALAAQLAAGILLVTVIVMFVRRWK